MTAPARITQAEIERCATAAKRAGWAFAHMRVDLANQTIELTLSDKPEAIEPPRRNPLDRLLESKR